MIRYNYTVRDEEGQILGTFSELINAMLFVGSMMEYFSSEPVLKLTVEREECNTTTS